MKLSELMTGVTPSDEYAGVVTAGDMVLAVDFTGKATAPKDYVVADEGVTEQTGTMEAVTADKTYLRSGATSTKTGTKRTFTLSGDRFAGDEFQDALLEHTLKFGIGQTVVRPYVYFNMLTGKGEQGNVSISVGNDHSGAAGDNAGWSATLTVKGTPEEYSYTAG